MQKGIKEDFYVMEVQIFMKNIKKSILIPKFVARTFQKLTKQL